MKSHRNVNVVPFPALITLPIQKSGNWILGVAKDGDSAQNVRDAVALFGTYNCDIVVCATKSYGASVSALNSFAAANPAITIVRIASTWVATGHAAANSLVASAIESHIP